MVPVRPSDGREIELKNPFGKAMVIAKIWRDPAIAEKITAAYGEKYLSETSELSDEQKKSHSELLKIMENYSKNRSYQELVSSCRDVSIETLISFSQNWLGSEHELLTRSLDDWKATAEEELKAEIVSEASKEETKKVGEKIASLRTYMDKEFSRLTKEIADLRKKLSSRKGIKEKKTTKTVSKPPENITGEYPVKPKKIEEPIYVRPAVVQLPRAKIWSKMWEDEKRRDSAKFLGAYLFTTEKAPQTILRMMGIPSTQSLLSLTDAQLTEATIWTHIRSVNLIKASLEQLSMLKPVGIIFLERLDYTPVGFVKGELVYTLPLTPGEKITVSHREWTKTTEEYVKEVEMTIEEERERAISENTEIAESSSSEQEVEQKVEVCVTAKGGMGAWEIEASAGYEFNKATKSSSEFSSKRNQEISSKAASRSKQEHKMSFRVAKEVHVEDEQIRVIENKSEESVRWDFYRMMKKWKIDLYHIGLRLTYDIVLPEPADYLLRKYVALKDRQEKIDSPFTFDLTVDSITEGNWMEKANEYGIELEKYPAPSMKITKTDVAEWKGKKEEGCRFLSVEFPEGYVITRAEVLIRSGENTRNGRRYIVWANPPWLTSNDERLTWEKSNKFDWCWFYLIEGDEIVAYFAADFFAERTPECLKAWQMKCFEKIKEAEHARWLVKLEGWKSQRDRLIAELMGQDSLKLRQMEREEIMKAVLRWLLGPDFEFYPEALINLQDMIAFLEGYGVESERLREELWKRTLEYGKDIKFIHQAIEWENVNWILYPYFWTPPSQWDFKQSLDHPDSYHRSFLRASCARVVLPIREGFEEDWIKKVENLDAVTSDHPYITLANEMKQFAHTNYAYIPDPNREELVEIGYLFAWDNVPGRDTVKLLKFLADGFDIEWVKDAEATKSDDGKTISITKEDDYVNIVLDEENERAILTISDRRSLYLKTRNVDDKIKIYQYDNPQDTWYEYTPTGALHIEKGEKPADQ
jgi:hypothetical protein